LSIVPTVRHADYLASWLDVLREDNRAIIRAASAASKAADYLLAFRDRELDAPAAANTVSALQPAADRATPYQIPLMADRPGDQAAVMHEETGIPYERCLVMCNMD
jgi:hypothetical protein